MIVPQVKGQATLSDDLSTTLESETQLPQLSSDLSHVCCGVCTLVDTMKIKASRKSRAGFLFEIVY